VLTNGKPTDVGYRSNMTAFAEALQKLGWVEGQNVRIDYRWTGDEADVAKSYAEELVGMAPEVILCSTTDNLIALQHATRSIPIVFTSVSDPVEQGFVASLARPGGNITGFTAYEFSIGGKWLAAEANGAGAYPGRCHVQSGYHQPIALFPAFHRCGRLLARRSGNPNPGARGKRNPVRD
jgi:putative tryptophan/tyrosine transport system substrate-binding protein